MTRTCEAKKQEVRTPSIPAASVHRFLWPSVSRYPAWSDSADRRGARYDRLIFVAGSADLDERGNARNPGDGRGQVCAAMSEVKRTVEAFGGNASDIVKLVVFHAGATLDDEMELLSALKAETAGDVPPVVSLVALPRLWARGQKVLIKAIAIDNTDGKAPRLGVEDSGGWRAGGGFSSGLRCGELVFVGAQTSKDASGVLVHANDLISQAKKTIENISHVLESLGCDLDDVVKLNTWYFGQGTEADWRGAAEVRSSAFRFPGPCATGVPVPGRYPEGGLVRQECLAIRGVDGNRVPRSLSWPHAHWDWPMRVTFQQGIRVGRLLVLGGQYSMDEHGLAVDPDDMVRQTANTFNFIENILRGFGASLQDLFELTCFFRRDAAVGGTPLSNLYLGQQRPAVTEVPLATMGLENVTLEVEGFAILPKDEETV